MAKWNIGSCIHNLGISWRCAVSVASLPLYTAADRYATHLIAGWIGHTPSLDTVKSKIFCPAGNWTPFLNHPAHSLVTNVWYQTDTLIQSFKVIWISLKWTHGLVGLLFWLSQDENLGCLKILFETLSFVALALNSLLIIHSHYSYTVTSNKKQTYSQCP